ncbi:MAG: DNA polymerase III subunit beta [Syntrophobacterales bacterium]|nr:DNA polymerase III subunit beta [Syntrophobacterales bacterium]
MNFSIKRDIFLNGIQKTLGIVERKTTLPILNNILIQTESEQIKIVATDREIGLISYCDAKIITQGKITVAARKLFEMIREIEGDIIEFEVMENNWVNVTCGKVIYKIPGISADDFPEVLDIENIKTLKIKCSVLKNIIDKTFFAISNDEMRPNLNGIFFKVTDGRINVVATDGHRLSLVNVPLESDLGDTVDGIIIPRKGVSEIRKLIEDGDSVDMCVIEGVCVIRKNNTILRISLIDAEYPDYKRVIPENGGVEIQLDKNQILHSLRRMSVMSTERFSGVKIEVHDQRMVLTSTNPDVGEAKDEIDVSYSGDMLEAGYNVRYLIDAMEPVVENIISFKIRGDEGPGIIGSAGNSDYMCIVMPVKLRKD